MLVLSRQRDESILIGDDLITIVEVRGEKIILGIETPQDIPSHRREVSGAIQRESKRASKLDTATPLSIYVPHQTPTYYSCFLSYSRQDEEFATQLLKRLTNAGIDVWFDQAEMKGGRKAHEQIDGAIRKSDKLLLILSESSMTSQWVETEIRWARRAEEELGERKLFPIRLANYEKLKQWECFDSDSGRDLAVEIREYHIPDFSHWNEQTAFDEACAGLISDFLK
jgi:carbon storage regulator CsrA